MNLSELKNETAITRIQCRSCGSIWEVDRKTADEFAKNDNLCAYCKGYIEWFINSGANLYKITADYIDKPQKPYYYVTGINERQARKRFKDTISWLKIYEVEKCEKDFALTIISEPMKHIVF